MKRWTSWMVMTGSTVAVLALLSPSWPALARDVAAPRAWSGRVGVDGVAVELSAAALWCVALWIAIGLLAASVARLPGVLGELARCTAEGMLPAALVRVLAGAAGLSVVLAPVVAGASPPEPATVLAAASAAPQPAAPQPAARPIPAVGWPTDDAPVPTLAVPRPSTPPNAVGTPAPTRPQRPAPASPSGPTVTVAPGDSLWLIAARRLGPNAGPAEVADAWPRWYAANASVIGPDPSLIRPGQVLHPPTPPHD